MHEPLAPFRLAIVDGDGTVFRTAHHQAKLVQLVSIGLVTGAPEDLFDTLRQNELLIELLTVGMCNAAEHTSGGASPRGRAPPMPFGSHCIVV